MSERIRVEMTVNMGNFRREFAAEALSSVDAVKALVAAVDEIDQYEEEEFDG